MLRFAPITKAGDLLFLLRKVESKAVYKSRIASYSNGGRLPMAVTRVRFRGAASVNCLYSTRALASVDGLVCGVSVKSTK